LGGIVHLVVLRVVVAGFEPGRWNGDGELLGLERMHVQHGEVLSALLNDPSERDLLVSGAVLFEKCVPIISGVQGIEAGQ